MCDEAVLIPTSLIVTSIWWIGGIVLALSIHRWILSDERGLWPPLRRHLGAALTKRIQRLGFPGKPSSTSLPSSTSSLSTPSKTPGDSLGNP